MKTYYVTLGIYVDAEDSDQAISAVYDLKYYGQDNALCKNNVAFGEYKAEAEEL